MKWWNSVFNMYKIGKNEIETLSLLRALKVWNMGNLAHIGLGREWHFFARQFYSIYQIYNIKFTMQYTLLFYNSILDIHHKWNIYNVWKDAFIIMTVIALILVIITLFSSRGIELVKPIMQHGLRLTFPGLEAGHIEVHTLSI